MASANINMLQIVANGLGELKDHMVFVGGAVAELYASDPASSDIRPTTDVDCVIELNSRMEYLKLEKKLRAKGFANDISNQWYLEGIEKKTVKLLPDGTEVFVFPIQFYLAAKFEAHKSRGGNDLRQSRDFEDIVYIFDNCPGFVNDIINSNDGLREYLINECQNLLDNYGLTEGIESALPYGSGDERMEIIEDLIQNIANIE